jgi:hypothetical protein
MQRVHVDDLAGHLIREGGWEHLNLPAIAEREETIAIGPARFHLREVGELLHPAREPREVLETMRRAMGSSTFEAQYQQSPVPPGGNMIKIGWFGRYDTPMDVGPREQLVISWDTAMKASEMHDYSVGTVWLVRNNVDFYLLEVIRERLEYPLLKRKVAETSARYARVSSYCNLIRRARLWTTCLLACTLYKLQESSASVRRKFIARPASNGPKGGLHHREVPNQLACLQPALDNLAAFALVSAWNCRATSLRPRLRSPYA